MIPEKGEQVMVTSDTLDGLEHDDVGTVVGSFTKPTPYTDRPFATYLRVRFPGRLKPVEIPTDRGYYEVLGKPGLEPEEE